MESSRNSMMLCILACLVCVVTSRLNPLDTVLRFDSVLPVDAVWADYKTTHGKQYKAVDEEIIRKQIFKENIRWIEAHNYLYSRGLKTFSLGINQFTDMDSAEVAKQMNGLRVSDNYTRTGSTYLSPSIAFTVPKQVDWRQHGYVTPVKNQQSCGSCWAFSTTGSVEGQHYRKTQRLVSLSEQNLVDCSTKDGNSGCNGGIMDNAFKYIKENQGIDTEVSYPYTAQEDKCHFNSSTVGATVSGFVDIPSGDEKALMEAVATVGPVSVAIDASHPSFQAYKEGVYDEPECLSEKLDHGVLIVGYGTTDAGIDYWIVKNSWSETWGESGYIRMVRNKKNQCGIASMASYPLV